MSAKQDCIFFRTVVLNKIIFYLGEEVIQFLDVFDWRQLTFIAEHHPHECLGKPALLLNLRLLSMQNVALFDRLLFAQVLEVE